jgi:hypothetical protein
MFLSLAISFYVAFVALSLHHMKQLIKVGDSDNEPTETSLAKATVMRILFLGSAVVFAILSLSH